MNNVRISTAKENVRKSHTGVTDMKTATTALDNPTQCSAVDEMKQNKESATMKTG